MFRSQKSKAYIKNQPIPGAGEIHAETLAAKRPIQEIATYEGNLLITISGFTYLYNPCSQNLTPLLKTATGYLMSVSSDAKELLHHQYDSYLSDEGYLIQLESKDPRPDVVKINTHEIIIDNEYERTQPLYFNLNEIEKPGTAIPLSAPFCSAAFLAPDYLIVGTIGGKIEIFRQQKSSFEKISEYQLHHASVKPRILVQHHQIMITTEKHLWIGEMKNNGLHKLREIPYLEWIDRPRLVAGDREICFIYAGQIAQKKFFVINLDSGKMHKINTPTLVEKLCPMLSGKEHEIHLALLDTRKNLHEVVFDSTTNRLVRVILETHLVRDTARLIAEYVGEDIAEKKPERVKEIFVPYIKIQRRENVIAENKSVVRRGFFQCCEKKIDCADLKRHCTMGPLNSTEWRGGSGRGGV